MNRFIFGSYKPCTHLPSPTLSEEWSHPPIPSQKMSHPLTPTHAQSKKVVPTEIQP